MRIDSRRDYALKGRNGTRKGVFTTETRRREGEEGKGEEKRQNKEGRK